MNIPEDKYDDIKRLAGKYWQEHKLKWLMDMDDFIQEVFLRILQNKHEHDPDRSNWSTYVFFESRQVHCIKAKRHFRQKRNCGEFCLSLDHEFYNNSSIHCIAGDPENSIERAILDNIPVGEAKIKHKIYNHVANFSLGVSWQHFVELLSTCEIEDISKILGKSRNTIYIFRRHLIESIFGKDKIKRRKS